ncbi:hypothetical protein T06_16826 [Trichinella sp. T6]|nr:hypothetical protein T06_16826 [Trichinella sp. T6]
MKTKCCKMTTAFVPELLKSFSNLFLMGDVFELHLVPNRCGDMSLVYEGQAYKLKRAGI